MKVLIFGATGMVGQGALRECLLNDDIEIVQTIVRTVTGSQHLKLRELVHQDFWHFTTIEADLADFDACFFCLGVSSSGRTEGDYESLTYGITLAAAEILSRLNPQMTFIYVSGAGTDSSERGRLMWARIKGRTENALLRLPFKAAYMFRPGVIEPLHGIKSKTKGYRFFYALLKPILPLLRRIFPKHILTTEQIGQAMITVAKYGYPKHILESRDIYKIVS